MTSVVVLYEVYRKVKKAKGEEMALEAVAALSQRRVVTGDQTLSLEAADYTLEHGLRMSDALVYATARQASSELYTSDEDLKRVRKRYPRVTKAPPARVPSRISLGSLWA